jgi:IS605 OrfB family transposase
MVLVYRYRVKNFKKVLSNQAKAINFVWNYCNNTQRLALSRGQQWLTGFDLNMLTTGCSKELNLHSGSINAVCEQYAKSRSQKKRPYLRYRGQKNTGWIPIKGRNLALFRNNFKFSGKLFRVFYSRPIPVGATIKDGSNFSQDSKGNWYLNVVIEISTPNQRFDSSQVGIDLGLKNLATLSTGEIIENPRHLTKFADKLGKAQRAKKKVLTKSIYTKIVNSRRDFLHKLSTRITKEFSFIAVGDVSASGLAKTRMAKSVLDVGWSTFRSMLAYKAVKHGAKYQEVSEAFSTQICSACGSLPESRPRGIADLGIRSWICSDCGITHDRDVNAAQNIHFRSGHRTLVVGIPAL